MFRELRLTPEFVTAVTSSFHAKRAAKIFGRLFPFTEVDVVVDGRVGTPDQIAHEMERLRELDYDLVDFGDLSDATAPGQDGLLAELRHYDNLAYLALAASFIVTFVYVRFLGQSSPSLWAGVSGLAAMVFSSMFFAMYIRLAGTASSLRQTYLKLCFLLGEPNLSSSQ